MRVVVTDVDEIGVVVRAREGDPAAFDELVERRLPGAYRLARAILGDTRDAEDATQEAFLSAWRGIHELRDPGRFDAWFTRIIVNSTRMHVRRRPSLAAVPIDSLVETPVAFNDPAIHRLIDADALTRALNGLPVEQRALLALYYLEDRPVAAVAAILGVPSGTVKWRLHRARAALQKAIAHGERARMVVRDTAVGQVRGDGGGGPLAEGA